MAHPRTPAVDLDIHQARRERFLKAIGDSVAVIPAAVPQIRSRDSEYRYRPDSDLYYLSGFREPEAVAVLTPHDDSHRFTLFLRPRDPDAEAWSGRRAGLEGAKERFGADAAYPYTELGDRLADLLRPADRIVYGIGGHPDLDAMVIEAINHFRAKRPRTGRGPTGVMDPGEWLHSMRRVKDSSEVARLRAACGLTAGGHRAAIGAIEPGRGEWEIEAVLEHEFRRGGGDGSAFAPIVAGGENATILHYVDNAAVLDDGQLVLIDAGAELDMYCGDVTRTVPVSGRFTDEQRAVYDIVREALDSAIAAIRPGAPFSDIHRAAVRVLCSGLIDLGLVSGPLHSCVEKETYKPFFMHRTSHWLGLDVHDVGDYVERDGALMLEEGMALTVEPGLYLSPTNADIPAELRGIGVRLEDDLLVTADGAENLTRVLPVDPEEVAGLVGAG